MYRRARLGFGRTFQRIELFGGMSVRDHLLVAERARRGNGGLVRDLLNLGRSNDDERERAQRTLDLLGLDDVADRPVESLSLGRGRLVEIGRALMTEPLLLLLDEPSSGLDQRETMDLVGTLQTVQRQRGTAVLLVEHDVEMVQRFATRLYVLDFGTLIASFNDRLSASREWIDSLVNCTIGHGSMSPHGLMWCVTPVAAGHSAFPSPSW